MKYILFLALSIFSMLCKADGAQVYRAICASCHATGTNKAPMVGDTKRWGKLIKEGQAHITADGYHGIRAMPARGGKPDLTLAEFASAVVYMANQSGGNWQEPDEAMLNEIKRRIAKKSAK